MPGILAIDHVGPRQHGESPQRDVGKVTDRRRNEVKAGRDRAARSDARPRPLRGAPSPEPKLSRRQSHLRPCSQPKSASGIEGTGFPPEARKFEIQGVGTSNEEPKTPWCVGTAGGLRLPGNRFRRFPPRFQDVFRAQWHNCSSTSGPAAVTEAKAAGSRRRVELQPLPRRTAARRISRMSFMGGRRGLE